MTNIFIMKFKEHKMIPGETIINNIEIELNRGLATKEIEATNNGDRPIQVGSHIHFFEVNKFLKFDREQTYGYRLDIASGTSVRFEVGETKKIQLVALAGNKIAKGINNLCDAQVNATTLSSSLNKAKLKGFI